MKELLPLNIGKENRITIIGGINVLEELDSAIEVGLKFKKACEKNNLSYVFKASFDKANRSSHCSYRGPGIERGLKMLKEIRNSINVPILTDIHEPYQASIAGEICDMLQLPAFLARQTDLIRALAETGRPINIKKPQYISPEQVKFIVEKFINYGCQNVIICERGTAFGYNQQIVDIVGLEIMKKNINKPICVDITHALQYRKENDEFSNGRREYALKLAKAVTATSIDALFIEAHENPELAKCDAGSAIPSSSIDEFIEQISQLDSLVKSQSKISIV